MTKRFRRRLQVDDHPNRLDPRHSSGGILGSLFGAQAIHPCFVLFSHAPTFVLDILFLSESCISEIYIYFNTFLLHSDSSLHSNATNQSLLWLCCLGTCLDLMGPHISLGWDKITLGQTMGICINRGIYPARW